MKEFQIPDIIPPAPNLEVHELIEPMIFEREDGTPLIDPLVYYDQPLDFQHPLPQVMPLGMEYFINWKKIDECEGKRVFPLDYLQQKAVQLVNTATPAPNPVIEDQSQSKKPVVVTVKPVSHKAQKEGEAEKPYDMMRKLIKKVDIIIVNDRCYVFEKSSYVPKSAYAIGRIITNKLRQHMPGKSPAFLRGIAELLLNEPDIYVSKSDLPTNYVAFQNCTLDIQTRKAMPSSPRYLILYSIKANYTPNQIPATPAFDAFLASISGGDPYLIERIMQMLGYCLTQDTRAKCFFLFQGVGNSGKSVLSNLLEKLFLEGIAKGFNFSQLSGRFSVASLIDKPLCIFADTEAAPLTDKQVSELKKLTGNDTVSSEIRFKGDIDFVCRAKIIITTNHALLTKVKDDAFFYRACVIPFRYSIPREHQDFDLQGKLLQEVDGIVTKAMLAYFRLVDNGYRFAGDFPVNEVVSDSVSQDLDYHARLYEFVKRNFWKSTEGKVFIEDAYAKFCEEVEGVHLSEFSSCFQQYANELFGAEKTRKRRPGSTNPISCLTGIDFIEEE